MEGDYIDSGNVDGDDIGDMLDTFAEIVEEEQQEQSVPDPSLGYLYAQHPETVLEYIEEIIPKLSVTSGHKSIPFLTTFERTKIIGFRSTQLSQGARPFITLPDHVTDVKEIARMELEARRLPFILKRPMPDGSFEYWRLSELMIL